MKLTRLALAFSVFALGVGVAASSHHVTVYSPVWVGATELKPGDYNVQVENGKAVFKGKKDTVEVPAKMESANSKFQFTALSTENRGGKVKLNEIELGGTNSKIVIESPAGVSAGE